MTEKQLPPVKLLPNGVLVPTEEFIIAIHDRIIQYRKQFGKDDPGTTRDQGLICHLCDTLADRTHKYTKNPVENALYVATETFYYIACQHPFTEGNKSTAYLTSLLVLKGNLIFSESKNKILSERGFLFVPYDDGKPGFMAAPKEAEEISKLAEAGKDEVELKRLIKEFLQKEIGAKL